MPLLMPGGIGGKLPEGEAQKSRSRRNSSESMEAVSGRQERPEAVSIPVSHQGPGGGPEFRGLPKNRWLFPDAA